MPRVKLPLVAGPMGEKGRRQEGPGWGRGELNFSAEPMTA